MKQPDWAVESYLEHIADLFGTTGGTFEEAPTILLIEDRTIGILTFGLAFPTGHRLYAHLEVIATSDFPDWRRYSFHYMDESDSLVFRYDNTAHHHGLPFFPDHKHVGDDVEGHPRPSIHAILRELE